MVILWAMLVSVFAETDAAGWIAIMGAGITAAAAAYVTVVQARAKLAADARQQQVTEHEKILDRQEKELDLHRRQIYDQQDVINRMHKAYAEAREEAADLYGFVRMYRNICVSLADELRVTGRNPPDVPELPARKQVSMRTADSEFWRRTTEQNTELIEKYSTKHPLPPGDTNVGVTPLPPTKGTSLAGPDDRTS